MINELAKDFKITSGQIPNNWDSDDFGTVYILKYLNNKKIKIIRLDASTTYPVSNDIESQMHINQAYYQLMNSLN